MKEPSDTFSYCIRVTHNTLFLRSSVLEVEEEKKFFKTSHILVTSMFRRSKWKAEEILFRILPSSGNIEMSWNSPRFLALLFYEANSAHLVL